jgi:hypothetical protein
MSRVASNALGCHPGLYARDPAIGELHSLVMCACGAARAQYQMLGACCAMGPGDKPRDDTGGDVA